MQPNMVDFVVTDPPYGLGFMEKDWDFDVPGPAYWKTIAGVCKPGALLLAFGGTRTWHRLVGAIEDADWEIRDCLMWLYGQGFPKSLDISKALDKAAGAEREVVGRRSQPDIRGEASRTGSGTARPATSRSSTPFRPRELAKRWNGWGSSLKPAWEPIVLAMKPLDGTFAQNADATVSPA